MSEILDRVFASTPGPRATAEADPAALDALVVSLIDGRRTVREVIAALEGRASAKEVQHAVLRLEAAGHLVEVSPSPSPEATATATMSDRTKTAYLEQLRARVGTTPEASAPRPSPRAPTTAPLSPMPERLGPYRIVRRVGAGGMGVVYEAVDEARNLRVALKTLLRFNPERLLRFKGEFRRVADVRHPNLANPYELMLVDGIWFFTMELIDGVDFLSHIRGSAPGEPPVPAPLQEDGQARLRAAMRQLVEAVATLHAHGLLHLDLKPGNVMVDRGGRVVVLDFGLSRELDPDPLAPFENARLQGTPSYIAPEQVLGQTPTEATDWYSVGIMLFEALTADLPFRSTSVLEALRARTFELAPSPSSAYPGVPADLDELCVRLLSREPSERPGPDELLARLGSSPAPAPAPHAAALPRTLVGREDCLEALSVAYQGAADDGTALFVHVRGLSGIGKSAAVQHFHEVVRARDGAIVLAGRCYEWESLPYKGLDEVIDALCRHLLALPSEAQASILGSDGHEAALLSPVLKSVRILDELPKPPARVLDPMEQRLSSFSALRRILGRLCGRGRVVVLLDDLQWGDVDGARLLAEVLAPPEAPPLLVVGAYRADEAAQSPFLRELAALRGVEGVGFRQVEIEIGPLGQESACRLAASLLPPSASPGLAEGIARESRGNPLFLEQLVRHAIGIGADTAPRVSFEQVVEARLERLPEDARRVLDVLAVAGRLPEQDFALALAGVPNDPHATLSMLRGASFLRTRGPRRTDAVEIYHDRLRECLTRRLSPERLRAVHGDVGRALEERGDTEPDVLARHFHAAGALARAAGHAVRAADLAYGSLAFDRAASFYRSALTWDGARADAGDLRGRLGRALFNAGRCSEAAGVHVEAAEAAAGQARSELRGQAAQAYFAASRIDEGLRIVDPLLRELKITYPASPRHALASVLRQLVQLQVRGVDFRRRPLAAISKEELFPVDLCWSIGTGLGAVHILTGFDFHLRSLLLALQVGEPKRVGRALGFLGASLGATRGWIAARGASYLDRAEALGRETDDPYLLGLASVFRGLAELSGAGRWKIAAAHAEKGIRMLTEGCTGVSWECDAGVSIALKALEPMGEMRELGQRAAASAREAAERGNVYPQRAANYYLGLYRLASGDVADARAQARRGMQDWSRHGYTVQHYYAARVEALCDLYEGSPTAAAARIRGAWPDIERAHLLQIAICRIELFSLQAVIELAVAHRGRWSRSRALWTCERLADRLSRERRVDGPPHADLVRAAVAASRGERGRATALLDRSADGFARGGTDLYAWCARRRKGELVGDRALVREADAWMAERGIAEPARWVDLHAPAMSTALEKGVAGE